eukprot:g22578.t1
MGEILNEYFVSVFTVEKDVEAGELGEINSDDLKSAHIKKEDMLEILKRTKVDKSMGPDQVYPRTLWEVREKITGPQAEIFVSLTATGQVLEDWKLANV